jgi:DNA-3-methyladenine glycosylase I
VWSPEQQARWRERGDAPTSTTGEKTMPVTRCEWPKSDLMIAYHDEEWGVPSRDDRHLFEHLVLEGAQAGLNWELVLKKRDGYRNAFADYDLAKIARFTDAKIDRLTRDPRIVRNRLKIQSVVANARAALAVQEAHGSLATLLWELAGGKTRHNRWKRLSQIPAVTPESERLSKELVRRGFKFFGPTGAYAFMQAVGLVNDHVVSCYRHAEVRGG